MPGPPAQSSSVPGFISKVDPVSFDETLARLEAMISEQGLTLFARVDHSAGAERIGLSMQPASVLMFGSPAAGTPLMVASPLLALEAPLKALVWQDRSGSVLVSDTDLVFLADRFELPHELRANIAGIGALIDSALQR
jgi:uncharacterized protein (DUF302 family)